MKLKDIVAILSVLIILVVSGWFYYHLYWTDQVPEAPTFGTEVEQPQADREYHNETLGFGFRYPSSYEITKEQLIDYSDVREIRPYVLTLTLEHKDNVARPKLILHVNKEPTSERAERTLTLLQDDIGVYLADVYEDDTLERDYVRTIGSLVMTDNNVYTWEFTFRRGRSDYQPHLEAMLDYFGIYQDTTTEEEIDTTEAVME
tara:strand:- start:85 stop:693 length:609 start_codon:yes stop_codon:yes gene_type:complete